MRAIFFRHAEAEPVGPAGDDDSRRLTPAGHRQAKASAEGIAAMGEQVSLILTSPLPRAAQTAEIAAKAWGGAEIVPLEALSTDFSARALSARLGELAKRGTRTLALIGHEPNLSDFAAGLIGAEAGALRLNKAGAACVAFEGGPRRGGGTLAWLLGRQGLARLAKGR